MPTYINVYAIETEKDKLNIIIIQIVTNNPVPEDIYPLRKPIIKRPKDPIKILNKLIGFGLIELPNFLFLKE